MGMSERTRASQRHSWTGAPAPAAAAVSDPGIAAA